MEYRPFLDAFKYSLAPTELQDRWNELNSYVYVISNRWDQKPATDNVRHLDPQWADSDERTIVSYSIYRIYLFVSDDVNHQWTLKFGAGFCFYYFTTLLQ